MDFLLLASAILINSGSVLFTAHPTPVLCGPKFVDIAPVNINNNLCVLISLLLTQLTCQNNGPLNQLCSANSRGEMKTKCAVRHRYTKDQLTNINKQGPYSVPSAVIEKLSMLGIQGQPCGCGKWKYKRGKRAGKKRRNIHINNNIVTGHITDKAIPTLSQTSKKGHHHTCSFLNIGLLNAQSVREKTTILADLISESSLDIFLLNETWLHPSGDEVVLASLTPDGYKVSSFPRQTGRGGGLCIVYRQDIKATSKAIDAYSTFECMETIVEMSNGSVTFITIYRPPPSKKNKNKTSTFICEFQDLLDTYTSAKSLPVILGDFNIHFEVLSNKDANSLKEILANRDYIQHVHGPTHRSLHTLDWITSSVHFRPVTNVQVMDKAISDHFFITFNMNIIKSGPTKHYISSRNTKDIDHDMFKCDLQKLGNLSAETYYSKLKDIIDKHAPLRSRSVTKRPSAPWMNTDIKRAKRLRRRAERQWRKSGLTVHRDIYKQHHCTIKGMINNAKKTFFCKRIADCPSSKVLFSVTNTLCGKSNDKVLPQNVPKGDVADHFANFFSNKIIKIRADLDSLPSAPPSHALFEGSGLSKFELASEESVKKLIKSSPPKSCCLDPFPTSLAIEHIDSIAPIITGIINYSLQSGIVPACFKHAVVTPLIKKPSLSPNELKNYRPVSNLPFISKLLEKVVLAQIKEYLTINNMTEVFQSAYKEFHNTETALLRIYNDLLLEADKGNLSILALLDLSAAFDTIDHSILIDRLQQTFGLSGTVLHWFKSYLSERTQAVLVDGNQSESFPLLFGVPQGSVLGPMLYTLYTQPLGVILRERQVNYHMYADDTQLYLSCPTSDISALVKFMGSCVDDVNKWMIENKLKMNEDKTEIILCNTSRNVKSDNVDNVTIGSERIPYSSKAKNLGVFFDESLSMVHQVNYLCRQMYCELRRIGQMACFLDKDSVQTLISAFLFSRLDYCNSLLVNLSNDMIGKIQRFQNNAARLILRRPKFEHVTPLLQELHWLPVRARIDYKIAVLCYKCLNRTAPLYLQNFLQPYIQSRQLRSAEKCFLKVPNVNRKRLGERSFAHYAPKLWNSLPAELRTSESEATFKRNLKTLMFRKAFSLDD